MDRPHGIIGTGVSIASASVSICAWVQAHGATLVSVGAGVVAIVAGGYAIQASRATTKLRKRQILKLEDEE